MCLKSNFASSWIAGFVQHLVTVHRMLCIECCVRLNQSSSWTRSTNLLNFFPYFCIFQDFGRANNTFNFSTISETLQAFDSE